MFQRNFIQAISQACKIRQILYLEFITGFGEFWFYKRRIRSLYRLQVQWNFSFVFVRAVKFDYTHKFRANVAVFLRGSSSFHQRLKATSFQHFTI